LNCVYFLHILKSEPAAQEKDVFEQLHEEVESRKLTKRELESVDRKILSIALTHRLVEVVLIKNEESLDFK